MKATAYLIESKYNYREKFVKAFEEGNIKHIKSLIKRGKVIPIEAEAVTDSCGNFDHAVIHTKFKKP